MCDFPNSHEHFTFIRHSFFEFKRIVYTIFMWLNLLMNLRKYPLRYILRVVAIGLIVLGSLSLFQDFYLSYEVAQTQKNLEVIRTEG